MDVVRSRGGSEAAQAHLEIYMTIAQRECIYHYIYRRERSSIF